MGTTGPVSIRIIRPAPNYEKGRTYFVSHKEAMRLIHSGHACFAPRETAMEEPSPPRKRRKNYEDSSL